MKKGSVPLPLRRDDEEEIQKQKQKTMRRRVFLRCQEALSSCKVYLFRKCREDWKFKTSGKF